jgi:hypothetical protein
MTASAPLLVVCLCAEWCGVCRDYRHSFEQVKLAIAADHPQAQFVWLDDPKKCPKTALGFDFDHARFTHLGDKVTFEVVAQTFGLDADEGLQRLGELVHYIDVGGIPVDEAAGVETLVRGLQAQHGQDDALLAASFPIFDTLYAAMKARQCPRPLSQEPLSA